MLGNVTPHSARPAGRSMVNWYTSDRQNLVGLLESTTVPLEDVIGFLARVEERIPTDEHRPEEIRTLKFGGFYREGPRTALIYEYPQLPKDLRWVLLNHPKPSNDERRALSYVIVTMVRSLHVHFQLNHPALRTQSFVFLGDADHSDLMQPYVLDWARPSTPEMYQHPEYQADKPAWFYQVWSLMMVLSEIAEWRPLDELYLDEAQLQQKKQERKQLVMSPEWKGTLTAQVFAHGFGFLEKDRGTLEQYSHWHIKNFYDKLCRLLAPPASQ